MLNNIYIAYTAAAPLLFSKKLLENRYCGRPNGVTIAKTMEVERLKLGPVYGMMSNGQMGRGMVTMALGLPHDSIST